MLDTLEVGVPPQANLHTWAGIVLTEEVRGNDSDLRDDFVEFPRSIENVGIAFQIKERKSEGGVKISLRSFPPYSVQKIAMQYGGGGHELASGCFMAMTVEEAYSEITRAIEAVLWGDA